MPAMNAIELQRHLHSRFPVENARHEWKAWHSLKSNVSGRKGEDLASYVSAFANMDGGCMVLGVRDQTLAIAGIGDLAEYTVENLPHRIFGRTPNLPSVGLWVEALQASDTGAVVWIVHIPRHAPRQPVYAHDKAWQRDGDSLVELRPDRLQGILREPLAGVDWSAGIVANATLEDLDPEALAKARVKFAAKHQQERWAADMIGWDTAEFLDRAKITLHRKITRSALILLGRAESVALLSPGVAEMLWKVPDERIAKHFGPPFILTTTALGQHIRNPNIKLFPATELLAIELPRYDTQVVLEGLHNCVAHQDYEQSARIVVLETPGRLQLTSLGGFVDGKPEDYYLGQRTPSVYRNPWLAHAMNNVGMIDKGGYGIRDMVATQRKRYLPLPDYEGSTQTRTVFNVYGQAIDENFSKLLMERTDLPLEQVIWLDRVQKRVRIGDDQAALLRRAKLIEGRKPQFFVAAKVAIATGQVVQYVHRKGLDARHYRALVLELLALGPQPRSTINQLLMPKLTDTLDSERRRKEFIKNLLQDMAREGQIQNIGGATKAAKWQKMIV
ncbi:MAG: transcriptional regulator [Rhodoferax sp.]|nr:transcriptional regulator [Rhodoferax sp.]